MPKEKTGKIQIEAFTDHHVITQPNPLRKVLRRVAEKISTIPSGARKRRLPAYPANSRTGWPSKPIGSRRLTRLFWDGFTAANRDELFRAAHDIKGDAATFGFPSAGAAAESLCRIIEHAPDLNQVPADLIEHHINAIQAIVRERTKHDTAKMASELSRQLRGVADEYLRRPTGTVPNISKQSSHRASCRGTRTRNLRSGPDARCASVRTPHVDWFACRARWLTSDAADHETIATAPPRDTPPAPPRKVLRPP